jgi:hypothetical protein
MGDTSTAFILDVYQLWRGGGANHSWTASVWPNVRLAAEFQLNRSTEWGMPIFLTATYDWFDLEDYDVAAYNAVLHITALRAAATLATSVGDDAAFAALANAAADRAEDAVQRLLWHDDVPTGGRDGNNVSFVAAGWSATGSLFDSPSPNSATTPPLSGPPPPLLTDTLYGVLWAHVLGLKLPFGTSDTVVKHLEAERALQRSDWGLLVWWPRNYSRVDRGTNMIWAGGSFSHAALSIYAEHNAQSPGLDEANKVIASYKHGVRDWWDWKDLAAGPGSTCSTAPGGVVDGQPWCNSHYTRQLIGWAVPLALSGQQFDLPSQTLTFSPSVGAPTRLPAIAGGFAGVLDTALREITVLSGSLEGINVTVNGLVVRVMYAK